MDEVIKELAKILKAYGSKILFFFFTLELLITSFIWITEKISIELGLGNIFILNTYALLPFVLNLSIEKYEPSKREHVIKIEFYLSVVFWGISRVFDFSEFNIKLFYLILGYLGFLYQLFSF